MHSLSVKEKEAEEVFLVYLDSRLCHRHRHVMKMEQIEETTNHTQSLQKYARLDIPVHSIQRGTRALLPIIQQTLLRLYG
jgi:hypothetical protein